MKKLIIVESPSKAKTIQKYLGGDIAVLASKGHVCDLPQRSLGIDVEHGFKPEYVISPDKADIIKKLQAAVKKYEEIYLATDPDREGEAISWHLKHTLNIENDNIRIEFHEISPKAVKTALENPRHINMDLVDSQQARRVLDRLVGYKISPILSKKVKGGASAGRVQSAALKMIVEREKEIRAFVPEEYWNIFAHLKKETAKRLIFKTSFNDIDGKKVKVTNKEQADSILSQLNYAKYTVDSVKKGTSESKPSPPFTTSTMQQEASQKLNMTADRSIRVAQQLYEGIDVAGEGLSALITYIRTDSVRVSADFAISTLDYIKKNYGKEYAPSKQNFYKTKSNAQDAHEAIRPISLDRTPQSLEGKIDRDQFRLYKLIYERYLASQMKNAVFNVMNVHIVGASGGTKYGFTIKGKSVLFKGYTAVYTATVEGEEDEITASMPDLNEGENLVLDKLENEQKFTKPPARYNDASIVKAMEENGIGRPSTYASIISVLSKREYTVKEGKNILPTPLGEAVCEYMEKYFPDIMNLTFTARMEGALDKIAEGGQKWNELVESYYPILTKHLIIAQKNSSTENKHLMQEKSDVVCEKCGAQMVVKDGKFGKFLACPNYPKCKNIKKIVESVGKCPKCGGDLTKRFTKTHKAFYGCVKYPDCDFVSWDLPAPYFCPDCGSTMRVTTKDSVKVYMCTKKECGHIDNAE